MADEGTYATTAEVQRKVPVGSSSTANVEAYINQYIKESERVIDLQCNFDFYTNYASQSNAIKELLRQAASALAAIKVICYDIDGFGNVELVKLHMNNLWTEYDEVRDKLKDDSYRKKFGAV